MVTRTHYPITPCPAPRMTAADKWKKRPEVLRYRAFRDEVRARNVLVESTDSVTFFIAMPSSWSQKKRAQYHLKPHEQKPDLDNLLKALLDAVYADADDAHIWAIHAAKRWAMAASIVVQSFT